MLLSICSGADAATHEKKITLSRAAGNQLVEHVLDDNVDFKSDKTADGRDVALADLDDGRRIELPELIPILISADHQDECHLPFYSPLFDASAGSGFWPRNAAPLAPISPQTSPAAARRQGAGHCLQSRAFRRPCRRR